MSSTPRRTGLLVAAGVGVAALLVLAGWLAVSIYGTVGQAKDLKDHLAAAQASLGRLDTAQAAADLAAVSASAQSLRASTGGLAWSIAGHLPLIGTSAQATTTVALVADDLATAARPLVTAVGSQTTTAGKVMTALNSPEQVAALRDAAQNAGDQLAGISPDGLMFGLSDAVASAQTSLPSVVTALNAVSTASGPLRSMLGADKPTTWLVMAQNPAEIRGSGGLFNAYLIVTFDNGNMTIVEAGSRKTLDKEYPNGKQIPYWDAVSPETASTWGPVLGEWATFNIAPDFPTDAKLAVAGMKQRGTPVDGVIAIDPTITAAILAGTGPVEHKGVTIDATNAVDFFTKKLYESFPGFEDVPAKDELAMGLTYATIDSALKRPLDASALWNAMSTAVEGGHLKVWSSNPTDQAWLETTPVAASFAQHPDDVIVGFVNATGGKLDPYITRDVTIDYGRCTTDGTVTVTVAMKNDAPTGLPPYVDVTLDQDGQPDPSVPSGYSRTFVSVYAPASSGETSSYVKETTRDGAKAKTEFGGTEGRPEWTIPVDLKRGESTTVVFDMHVTSCPASPEPGPGS